MKVPHHIENGYACFVLHPIRFQIVQYVRKSATPQYIGQIAKAVKIDSRTVSYHISLLHDKYLLECKWEVRKLKGHKRGVAIRLCSTTPTLELVFKDIVKGCDSFVDTNVS
jgi:predicted transcriptional regulator